MKLFATIKYTITRYPYTNYNTRRGQCQPEGVSFLYIIIYSFLTLGLPRRYIGESIASCSCCIPRLFLIRLSFFSCATILHSPRCVASSIVMCSDWDSLLGLAISHSYRCLWYSTLAYCINSVLVYVIL